MIHKMNHNILEFVIVVFLMVIKCYKLEILRMIENELEIFDRPIDVINWIKRMSNLEFFKNVDVIPFGDMAFIYPKEMDKATVKNNKVTKGLVWLNPDERWHCQECFLQ